MESRCRLCLQLDWGRMMAMLVLLILPVAIA